MSETTLPKQSRHPGMVDSELSDCLARAFHAFTPVPHLLVGFSVRDSICLLDLPGEPLTITGYLRQIVVGKFAPIFFGRTG